MAIKLTPSEELKQVAQNLLGNKFKINVEKLEKHETINIPVDLVNFVEQIIF